MSDLEKAIYNTMKISPLFQDKKCLFGDAKSLDYLIIFAGIRARSVIEMPPFGAQRMKSRFSHHAAQKAAVVHRLARETFGLQKNIFLVNVGKRRHIINACAHGYAVALLIGNGNVYRQPVIVQPAAVDGIAHVYILARSGNHVPHFLLHRHGARGIVHFQSKVGVAFAQNLLRPFQSRRSLGVKVCRAEIGVERFAGKVVGTRIHQARENCGVNVADTNHSLPFHRLFRFAFAGFFLRFGVLQTTDEHTEKYSARNSRNFASFHIKQSVKTEIFTGISVQNLSTRRREEPSAP